MRSFGSKNVDFDPLILVRLTARRPLFGRHRGATWLSGLVRAGWLKETANKTGGRDKRRWAVNSKLFAPEAATTSGTAESRD